MNEHWLDPSDAPQMLLARLADLLSQPIVFCSTNLHHVLLHYLHQSARRSPDQWEDFLFTFNRALTQLSLSLRLEC